MPVMGYLANAAMGRAGSPRAGSKSGRISHFLAIFFVLDFQGEIFISKKERTNRNKEYKESRDCFCLFCFSLHVLSFFLFFRAKLSR